MPVEMQLRRIVISDISDLQVVTLQEVDGERKIPIIVGLFEASSINRRVKKENSPRPLTHDLIIGLIEQMGGTIDSIVICELVDQTFYAKLRVKKDGEIIVIDSRPSDAIAIAVTADVPIFVEEEVFEELGEVP